MLSQDGRSETTELEPEEIEMLARAEHDRWIEDRLRQGWRFGLRRDVAAKLSPYLVAWEELAEGVRDLDRDSVRAIPHLLAESGLKIVRRPREPE
ncbi:MAG: RyR domain-containing protein [Acidimicrobiales bacterium]